MSLQSAAPLAVALRGLGAQRLAAAWLNFRSFSHTSMSQQSAQPAAAEEEAMTEAAGKARWQQELGAVRTDWT